MNDEILIYVKYDENNSIIAIRSNIFIDDLDGWTKIDEWTDEKDRYLYAHADNGEYVQELHGKPLFDELGHPNFHDEFVEWSEEEKEQKYLIVNPDEQDEKEKQEELLKDMMFESEKVSFLIELSDNEAAKIPLCYPSWGSCIGKPLPKLNEQGKENRIEYQGELWKVRQDISIVLENQLPGLETASLYERIDIEHKGTIDDPIPYDKTMTVYIDKYYMQNGILYLCIEDSGQPLYADCENLPRYFQKVEE